jgi:hypothetical protein
MQISEKWTQRGGWLLSGLTIAFLILDAIMKILEVPISVDTTAALGYPAYLVRPMGMVLLASTLLYALPQTTLMGAILVTGYLGGAIATQLRVENPLFSHVLFGVYVGLLLWGGIYLRKPGLRALLALHR